MADKTLDITAQQSIDNTQGQYSSTQVNLVTANLNRV
ncbi:hypothetical protein [Acinetobacter sedimenti]